MATDSTVTVRMDSALKNEADRICNEMGLSISSAITIFIKRLVNDRAIPFKVSAPDHFYSEENRRHLDAAIQRMERGEGKEHDLSDA